MKLTLRNKCSENKLLNLETIIKFKKKHNLSKEGYSMYALGFKYGEELETLEESAIYPLSLRLESRCNRTIFYHCKYNYSIKGRH